MPVLQERALFLEIQEKSLEKKKIRLHLYIHKSYSLS